MTTPHPAYDQLGWKHKARRFIQQCVRVLKITKKPDATEFRMLTKVTGLGIAVLGLLGFLLFMIKTLTLPF